MVGQTSGQCVKPKKTTTTLPRKSASVRGLPLRSVSSKSLPKSAPVTSVALKLGDCEPDPQAAEHDGKRDASETGESVARAA